MAYVIGAPCVDVMDLACTETCPVECMQYEEGADRKLYIDPDECIDCGACEEACPVDAVFADDDLKLVRAIVRGDVHKSLGRKIITEARTLAAEKGYGILCDVRKATVRVALVEWFYLPRELEVLKRLPTRIVRVAVVVAPKAIEDYRFYENVATNVGLRFKVFLDEDKAIAWMT